MSRFRKPATPAFETLAAFSRALSAPAKLLPLEHALLVSIAGVVGVYAGIAAGILANCIRLFEFLFYRIAANPSAAAALDWRHEFGTRLHAAAWHPELAACAILLIAGASGFERMLRRRGVATLQVVRRIHTLGYGVAFGFVLYYPLLVITAWNQSVSADRATGGLYALLVEAPLWFRLLFPAVGALGASLLVRYVSPESGGHGVGEILEALVVPERRIPGRVAVWKGVAAGLVMGSGGSAGREGPVVQMGGAVGSFLGRRLGMSRDDIVTLVVCGGGAGIAASFNAPFAGMAFALEILVGDFAARSFAPVVVACVASTITARALVGEAGQIVNVTYEMRSGFEILVYILLGVFAGICSIVYIRSVLDTEALFAGHGRGRLAGLSRRLARLPPALRPVVAAVLVGTIGLVAPRALGTGVETMNAALLGTVGAGVLLVTLFAKTAATGLTLGSNAPGGSFFPAVCLGAILGGIFGSVGHRIAPSLIAGTGAYAAVGMGAVVAGATLAPITGILMLFELTRSASIIVPLMISCGIATLIVEWRVGGSIYTLGLRAKGLRRLGERVDLLRTLRVRDIMQPVSATPAGAHVVPDDTPLGDALRWLAEGPLVIVDRADPGVVLGALGTTDVLNALDRALHPQGSGPTPTASPISEAEH